MKLRLGEFVFDGESRRLMRGDAAVPLSPKAFQLLELLLAERPRAVPKETLFERIWPEVVVSPGTLAVVVAEVRRALGDDGKEGRFIRTVLKYGYAFAGQALDLDTRDRERQDSSFYLRWGLTELPLRAGRNTLGREDADVRIEHSTVSRRHALITTGEGNASLEDLGSRNGTFVRGERIQAPQRLIPGDVIQLGAVKLMFRARRAGSVTESCGTSEPFVIRPARLIVLDGMADGTRFELDKRAVYLGRGAENDVDIDDPGVSSKHAVIVQTPEEFAIADIGSVTGTFVNDQRIDKHLLRDGDVVRIGPVTFRFASGPELSPDPG